MDWRVLGNELSWIRDGLDRVGSALMGVVSVLMGDGSGLMGVGSGWIGGGVADGDGQGLHGPWRGSTVGSPRTMEFMLVRS